MNCAMTGCINVRSWFQAWKVAMNDAHYLSHRTLFSAQEAFPRVATSPVPQQIPQWPTYVG